MTEATLRYCANPTCRSEFISARKGKIFCCHACANKVSWKHWKEVHPIESQKAAAVSRVRRHTKQYLTGDLPKWMFT